MVERLSQAYKKVIYNTFAYCSSCGKVYIDDMPTHGTLYCPNKDCGTIDGRYCLQRGLKEKPQ